MPSLRFTTLVVITTVALSCLAVAKPVSDTTDPVYSMRVGYTLHDLAVLEDTLNRMEGLDEKNKTAFAEFEAKMKRQIRAGEADDGETDPSSYGIIQIMDFVRQVPNFPQVVIDSFGRAPDDFWTTAPVYMWYCTRYAYKQALISEKLTDLDPDLQRIDKEALRVLRRVNTSYSTISEATNYVRYTLLSGLENKAKDQGVDSLFSVARLQFQNLQLTAGRMTELPVDQKMIWGSGSSSQADDEPAYSVIIPSVSPVPEPSSALSLVPSLFATVISVVAIKFLL